MTASMNNRNNKKGSITGGLCAVGVDLYHGHVLLYQPNGQLLIYTNIHCLL